MTFQPSLLDSWTGREFHNGPDQFGRYTFTDRWYVADPVWCGVCGRAETHPLGPCQHVGTEPYYRRGQVFFRALTADELERAHAA